MQQYTLENFYKSKQWQKLLSVIKLERVNEDGQLICWHCGKPITDKYDCIGHHTIFLTDDNVNNSEISLNPELIQLVHHRCHNKIHNKLGYTKREIFLVYGPPLSGKSSYVSSVAEPGDMIIDINKIWECISVNAVHSNKLNAVVFGVRNSLIDMVKYRVGRWDNCYIIGGYPLISERERLCKELGAREIFIDVPKEECLKRLELSNSLDKEAYKKYIEEWFRRFSPDIPPSEL
jgi:predicted kinase